MKRKYEKLSLAPRGVKGEAIVQTATSRREIMRSDEYNPAKLN
jgi:hypothetical protein